MSQLKSALLADRGVIGVSGPDALTLLQGVVTADLAALPIDGAAHAGLLSPQGKILFDFFVVRRDADDLLIETARASVVGLVQRLSMYKLRARVQIEDRSKDFSVFAMWGQTPSWPAATGPRPVLVQDPRLPALGCRALLTLETDFLPHVSGADPVSHERYEAHRIGLGVPEAGRDFELGDTFPHEALYDQTGTVSFTKGCYVGQEVVSRMQHRGTARKRVVMVRASSPLPASGTPIRAGAATIGTLGSTQDTDGLALLRTDRAAEALSKGEPVTAGDLALHLSVPPFATFKLEPPAAGDPA
ncbi:MAG: folate-binding protein [Hyphomicrobiaceae bacterium]|nr:folate-binding protein [Hyphomicrobiaceae bacterium]